MFIPRGKPLHENLATSYVLVDALVADLSEGGFSGLVEVVLSHAHAFILMARGEVAASLVASGADGRDYLRTSLKELAASARRERGRVSVYSYQPGLAETVAGRARATPLYTGLSTEFADLGKMISKLRREPDRQWFVEVSGETGGGALVHLNDVRCRVMIYRDGEVEAESDGPDLDNSPALGNLLDECSRTSSTFDVYYLAATATPEPGRQAGAFAETIPQMEMTAQISAQPEGQTQPAKDVSDAVMEAKAIYRSLSLDQSATATAEEPFGAGIGTGEGIDELSVVRGEVEEVSDFDVAGDAMRMAEIKRLMGDIARTIEVATQAVEQRDSFSMYLRASQLKIADRYPFLDPFGAEFEYLAGEIAFVGEASPDEFVEGLTQALKLAAEAVTQASAQSARLRSRITDDLRWLYERHQQEFQQYGLDRTIGELVSA